jgi:hypothetical protein
MNPIENNQSQYNKICEQCQSRISNDEVLVSVWRFGKTSILNCKKCLIVKHQKLHG